MGGVPVTCPQDPAIGLCPRDGTNSDMNDCYTRCVDIDLAETKDLCPKGFAQEGRECYVAYTCAVDKTALAEGRTVAQYCRRIK